VSVLDVVHSGVAIANRVTAPFQELVSHEASHLSTDGYSTRSYDAPIVRPALVEWVQRQIRTTSGELAASAATVTVLDPTVLIDIHDRLTLSDGLTRPILNLAKPPGRPLTEAFLG
jgi:hypothetical protein